MHKLAILYEHPAWFRPLIDALERRGVPYEAIDATAMSFDPTGSSPAPVVLNRIAMSAFLREPEHPIFFAQALLAQWERAGARVLNGAAAMAVDASKARQLSLIARLGLAGPATRVVHRTVDLVAAAAELRWPLLVKANIGGSGAGIARFDSAGELAAAVADGSVPKSIDCVLLLQEFAPARGGEIIRVETLGERFLYAIAVNGGGAFDLCPADACQAGSPVTMRRIDLAPELVAAAERIVQAADIDVGGVELLIDDRDGTPLFYDINALSNFVANPLDVLGWDPHERLVDWLAEIAAERPMTEAA